MMADQPRRVTPGEISDLLDAARQLGPGAPLIERTAYQERKASLLSRIAAELGTAEAHEVAADAGQQLSRIAARLDDAAEVAP